MSKAEAEEKPYLASMGIYVFKKQALCKLLNDVYPSDNDFGGEIIPKAAQDYKVRCGGVMVDGGW